MLTQFSLMIRRLIKQQLGHNQLAQMNRRKSMSSDDSLYLAVAKELTANVRDEALWTKAFALESGDEARTKAHYIRLRVEKMQRPVETDAPPVKHAASTSEGDAQNDSVKSVVSIPNVLVLALYLAVAYGIAQKYGFSVFSLARALGVCLIPVGVCLVWNFRKGDVTWLRITSIVVTAIFGVIFVASALQEAMETRAGAPGPDLSWSPESRGDHRLDAESGSAPAKSSEGSLASETTTAKPFNPFDKYDRLPNASGESAVHRLPRDWRELSRSNESIGYYDANSIVLFDGKVSFSWLADQASPDQYGAFSTVFEMEVSCSRNLGRFVSVTGFRQRMGIGEKVFEDKIPSVLSEPHPDSSVEYFRKQYCNT
ncbi:surface-adhesin E family protein [Quatrionicoccus australiensis]|uniref:surface-adhesin E family protein n=1 Tax=Quatrionicoccus australiensis TaxID=138118 RepID=UPI001CF8A540|nr:surface-adhesin E family protein [Quatrionicoccus australiensis]UCV14111.1 hypothetical protein KI612_14325 [Quatrionicoccus australiensis]